MTFGFPPVDMWLCCKVAVFSTAQLASAPPPLSKMMLNHYLAGLRNVNIFPSLSFNCEYIVTELELCADSLMVLICVS